jgi:hypothetical protein
MPLKRDDLSSLFFIIDDNKIKLFKFITNNISCHDIIHIREIFKVMLWNAVF